jgi:ubiquinone/menaquinone biosynthesis C-methylase UbiE
MKEFWEKQAIEHGDNVAAVNFDPIQEDLVVELLNEIVPDGMAVADMGCGNGRALIELAVARPNGRFVGYDFAENMVSVAEARRQKFGLSNVRFACFDATDALPSDAIGAFDIVLGKRLLINVKGPTKLKALKNIADMLKPGGTYIMVECFDEPLQRINKIRAGLGLERIVVRSFNEYLIESFIDEVRTLFTVERIVDRDSLYYFISRIFNAYLSGGKPDYHAPINQLAGRLVHEGVRPMTGYSPEVTYVLKKR